MARTTLGAWARQAFGKHGAAAPHDGADVRIGKQVLTNDGATVGTILSVWQSKDATDGASHDETLGIRLSAQDSLLYIPTSAVARSSDQGLILAVDMAQVTARGWRYRPDWIPAA